MKSVQKPNKFVVKETILVILNNYLLYALVKKGFGGGDYLTSYLRDPAFKGKRYSGNPFDDQPLVGFYRYNLGDFLPLERSARSLGVFVTFSWEKYYDWMYDSGRGFWQCAVFITIIGYTIQWAMVGWLIRCFHKGHTAPRIAFAAIFGIWICLWALWTTSIESKTKDIVLDALEAGSLR
jgi:hypothetical protein